MEPCHHNRSRIMCVLCCKKLIIPAIGLVQAKMVIERRTIEVCVDNHDVRHTGPLSLSNRVANIVTALTAA